jgi:hypothetical protein
MFRALYITIKFPAFIKLKNYYRPFTKPLYSTLCLHFTALFLKEESSFYPPVYSYMSKVAYFLYVPNHNSAYISFLTCARNNKECQEKGSCPEMNWNDHTSVLVWLMLCGLDGVRAPDSVHLYVQSKVKVKLSL